MTEPRKKGRARPDEERDAERQGFGREKPTRTALLAEAMGEDRLAPLSRREWWRGAMIYQVYVRSFCDASGDGLGDLAGIRQKLDYIEALGVTGLWLSPIYPSPQKDFGYDISDFRSIDPRFGTMEDFAALLDDVHDRGLKLLLDFVPGHTSDEHRWFDESRASRDNPRADWYVWADAAPDGGPPNNWLSSFGGSAWTWEPRRSQYYYHPFLVCQPALDLCNPVVRDAICDEMRFWLDRGVDGFRIDAAQCLACDPDLRSNPPVPSSGSPVRFGGGPNNPFARQVHMFDRDVPEAMEIVRALRRTVEPYTPERALIAELADIESTRMAEKYTAEGRAFHAVYDFDVINGPQEPRQIAEFLRMRDASVRSGWMLNAFGNHDAPRSVSNLTDFAEDAGEREAAAKLLVFLLATLKGGAILYQGEELGLPQPALDYSELRDPWGLAFWPDFEGRDGARTPMPWEPDGEAAGFSQGTPWIGVADEHRPLAVSRQEADPESCLSFCRALLAWRQDQPLLLWGEERVHPPDLAPLILWDRFAESGETLTCVVNFSLGPRFLTEDDLPGARPLDAPGCATSGDGGVHLPPLGFAILTRD